jgi:ethanolamine utilization protein EutN
MQLARVLGTATATIKHPTLTGWKLLLVQPWQLDGKMPDGEPLLVVDGVGAGTGDTVLITSDGRGARELLKSDQTPVRWTAIGIRD